MKRILVILLLIFGCDIFNSDTACELKDISVVLGDLSGCYDDWDEDEYEDEEFFEDEPGLETDEIVEDSAPQDDDLGDDSGQDISVDEDGVEWWEDEEGVWWYRSPEMDDWEIWEV